jgi:glutamine synthetase
VGIADPETFCQLPWEPKVARVFCTLFRNREEPVDPGGFLSSDCRGNLKRQHADFEKKHGLRLRLGTEPEMMWLKKGADGKPDGGVTRPFCYHIDQFEELRPITLRVTEYCRKMGIDCIQGDHEDAPGQLELNWTYDDVERTSDRLTTYRQICAQVAREFNVIACFMTKPFMRVSANGCHHNFSLWKGRKDAVLKLADYIGSTTQLLKFTETDSSTEFIVATETGILHQMMKNSPGKQFIPAPPDNACACNDCPHMKLNSLEKLYLCMEYGLPEIHMDEALREAARAPIERMLRISTKAGL